MLIKNAVNIMLSDFLQGSRNITWDFPGGSVVKNLPANSGDSGLIHE